VTSRSGAILKTPILRERWELNNDDVILLEKIGRVSRLTCNSFPVCFICYYIYDVDDVIIGKFWRRLQGATEDL